MPASLTIKFRLVAVLTLMTISMAFIGGAGIVSLGRNNAMLKEVYEERLVSLGQLDAVIRGMNSNQLTLAKAVSGDPAKLREAAEHVEQRLAVVSKQWEDFAAVFLNEEEKQLAGQFAEAREQFQREGLAPALAAARAGDNEALSALVHGKLATSYSAARDRLDTLIKYQLDNGKADYEASQASFTSFRLAVIGMLAAGVLLAAGIGWWLVRSITHPLDRAVRAAQAVAGGDLTLEIEVHSADETGQLLGALRDMTASLSAIVGNVRQGTNAIHTAATEIASGNMDLSSRTEQQAGSLEETASSMEELTSTVRQNADNARQANQLAASASEVATRGGAVVAQVVDKMGAINESAYKIVEIITVIDSIAFQTNILALNAAVEAARAGEQGRGFAVVASEVRTLAQRAASAAKEIKDLIDNSVAHVEEGSRLVDLAGGTMQEVVNSVQRVTDVISEISSASSEQTAGIEQINEAVVQMDAVTQQNAALVEQAAAAADSLQDQAKSLAHAVGVFRLPALDANSRIKLAPRSAVVTRLPTRRNEAAAPAAPARPARVANASGGDGWQEF